LAAWSICFAFDFLHGTRLAEVKRDHVDPHHFLEQPNMISCREDVTKLIVSAKVRKGIKWRDVTEATGLSKEWTTAACLGQMTLTKPQAEAVGKLFELSDEAIAWLQIVPYKGSLPTAVPTDPLIYRWYELVSVYGTTIKELIHEEFGDGIMSAIDFSMDIQRTEDPKGDRVNVVLSGKFLPYKTY
jgi:cyanate lyase